MRYIFICLTLLVSGCAAPRNIDMDEAKRVGQIYKNCIGRAILLIDDRISDAGTVGRAAAPMCRTEFEAFWVSVGGRLTTATAGEASSATREVLALRARRR